MRMRYVSNAGILLETENESIGIDCFCRHQKGIYYDTTPEMKTELLEEIRRGKIKALFFTHEHGDHFLAEDIVLACKENIALKVWGNQNVIKALRDAGVSSCQLEDIVTLKEAVYGDIKLRFLDATHIGEQYADIQNYAFLINIGRSTIVVTGDAHPRKQLFEQIGEWSKRIDWLMAPFSYVGLLSARKAIRENVIVQNIFVLHQPQPERDAEGWIENTKKVCGQAQDGLPEPVFPESPGSWYKL